MKREVVTSKDIARALSQGFSELVVADNAILTAHAKEEAERMGLKLRAASSAASGAAPTEKETVPTPTDAALEQQTTAAAAAVPLPDLPFLRPPAPPLQKASMPENGPRDKDGLRDMVRKTVAKALQSSHSDATADAPQKKCAQCGACSGRPETQQAPPGSGNKLQHSMAGRVKAVCSQKLPWRDFPGKTSGRVNIVDVITSDDGSPMGGGYLEWNNASFSWRLAYAELDIVLEGELHITSNGETVVGRPGDMLFIPRDTDVTFSSPGYVRFAYATWPADWSALSGLQDGGN